MNLTISEIDEHELSALLALVKEFAEFEKLEEYCTVTEERMAGAMFGAGAVVEGLIAKDSGRAVAYAIFYPNFASFRGQRGYYLEDIYITAEYRGKGIGEALIRRIAEKGRSRGFERIDFQVLGWNTPAIKFYEKLGAQRDDEERHFKFTDDAFDRLAGNDPDCLE